MAEAWAEVAWTPSAVTWVPLSRERLAARGYDQARALARAVAPRLGVPAVPLVRRLGDPGPQARRGAAARREAMRGVFAAEGVSGRVVLVDDVLTTGATGGACASALLEAGAAGGRAAHGGPSGFLGAAAPAYTRPRARVRVCGCPGEPIPGSRCQPRAKRPT